SSDRISDRYGNELEIAPDGIFSNRGRELTFVRDHRGNITRITDPAGFQLRYQYDSEGRLVAFYDRRASKKLDDGLAASPTRFVYRDQLVENTPQEQANYLAQIIDPLGVTALSADYDETSGRLIGLTDADGKPALLDYDIENLTVESTSSSGRTQVTLDSHGNPIRQVDEVGQVTLTTYHDPVRGLPAKVTQVIGDVDTQAQVEAGIGDDLITTYGYNGYGQRDSETDPRGNTTRTIYDATGFPRKEIDVYGNVTATYAFFDGQLNSTVDADGNATLFEYDDFGNVTKVTQSNAAAGTSTATSFKYDTFGDLIETTDPDGNVRTIQYNNNGDQLGTSFTWIDPLRILPNQTLGTTNVLGPDGSVDASTDAAGNTTATLYDDLGRAFIQVDDQGLYTRTLYDRRGLAIETRSESLDQSGNIVQLISRTVYDDSGRAVYSTGSFPEDTPAAEITGTHTIFDPATGQVLQTQQLLGLDIDIVGSASNLVAELKSAGSTISVSTTLYDDAGRVRKTIDGFGLQSQTLYGQFGEVVESRTETVDSAGTHHWLVSRTLYDSFGRVEVSTDRFVVPIGTPLGEDPVGGAPPTQVTKTIYDDRGRTIATERYIAAVVSLTPDPNLDYSPPPVLSNDDTLESVNETLYDEAGRVYRTITGRVPVGNAPSLPATYPTHGNAADRYENANLTSGVITDTLFDDRGRQYATLGHPLPAAEIGLSGGSYDGNLVRLRTETIYDSYGQPSIQRSGLAHIETPDGTFVDVLDQQSVDIKSYYDAFGNVYRSDYITGGTITYDPLTDSSSRSGQTLHSYTLVRFDDENRPIAEMQQTDGSVTAVWSDTENSFIIDSTTTKIPTKLYHYNDSGQLVAVELPAVADPLDGGTIKRPKYQYAYDEQGNQTLIVDPLGRETRFTFTERGQQATRTLPLGFGSDGIASAADLAALETDPSTLGLTEQFTYDTRGRQQLQISFEGVHSENVYDSFGRMSAIRYYQDAATYTS
ncbi:MAG: hypothetical protein MI861_26055, partial [Pirellulales bacterium]|nr:hypothetical protein [Pirellulales bacterium]